MQYTHVHITQGE